METQQLLDALTDHMAVYHCRRRQLERQRQRSSPGKSDRLRVVEWLARLSVQERQIACTIVDEAWVALVLQMRKKLEAEGPGSFFVLPDFPSASRKTKQDTSLSSSVSLPGLCFRRSRGLLKRLSCNGELLARNLRLYSSLDGEMPRGLAGSIGSRSLDSVTVSCDLLENIEQFVAVMDEISYGEFLASQCLAGGSSWEETQWLKSMGYYSLPAFVANRLEICIWSAWVTSLGTKQPPKSISRSLARHALETMTTASKVCRRRQGFEHWWSTLNARSKRNVSDCALLKLSMNEAQKMDGQTLRLKDDLVMINKDFGRLCLGIQMLNDLRWTLTERVVYSSLLQVHSHSEAVLQVLRNILMKVMKDSMEYDLLDHGNKSAPRDNYFSKRVQVKNRKNKTKKQKRNVNAVHRSLPDEDKKLQPENMDRIGDVTNELVTQQVGDQCKDTSWMPGKKKKRIKKARPAEMAATKNATKAQVVENETEESIIATSEEKMVPVDDVVTTNDVKQEEPKAVETTEVKIRANGPGQVHSIPPVVKNKQAYHVPALAMPSSHEWPGAPRSRYADYCGRPPATEWLHLDVNREYRSKPQLIAYAPRQNGQVDTTLMQRTFLSKASSFSWDWPPIVQPGIGIASPFGFAAQAKDVSVPLTTIMATNNLKEVDKAIADDTDCEDVLTGDSDDHLCRTSEGEGDPRQLYDIDYNQFFGGGVMYWTSADYTGMGYSRPGSLSSEDSSWARHEADLTIVVDDIVGLPPVAASFSGLSSGTSTMTCTSPSSARSMPLDHSFEVQGKSENNDHTPPPALPPIAVRSSKLDGSKRHEARSPHEPRGRQDFVRSKRSPSPVLRCVPPAPPPPPPSPVAGVSRRRGFPSVRSGSSSPRHWVVFNWPDKSLRRFIPMPGHPDVAFPLQTSLLHKMHPTMPTVMAKLHKEIEAFCLQVAAENSRRKPFINIAVNKVTHALQVLWPRSRTKIFGSIATGLSLPNSDVDLVVCLPPVRNLEPIKEAGILEGRNGIKETCLQHAARYLADQEWVKSDSLKTVENTTIPLIMLVVKCFPDNLIGYNASDGETSGQYWGTQEDRHLVRLDISFESTSHSGVLTADLVKELIGQFPAISPLALVLKQFLMDRGLDQPYTGGLGSYCLVLLITHFLQQQPQRGWPSQTQSLGSLLMDFLHFYGRVFDPPRMCISIRGGMYVNRSRAHAIDPLEIEDPLHAMNNVGRNCFRILQCTKAFADAYVTLEKELQSNSGESSLLTKILPSLSSGQ